MLAEYLFLKGFGSRRLFCCIEVKFGIENMSMDPRPLSQMPKILAHGLASPIRKIPKLYPTVLRYSVDKSRWRTVILVIDKPQEAFIFVTPSMQRCEMRLPTQTVWLKPSELRRVT